MKLSNKYIIEGTSINIGANGIKSVAKNAPTLPENGMVEITLGGIQGEVSVEYTVEELAMVLSDNMDQIKMIPEFVKELSSSIKESMKELAEGYVEVDEIIDRHEDASRKRREAEEKAKK